MTVEVSGRGTDPAPGAGRLLAGSIESPELASLLAFRLPASCWEALVPLPGVVLCHTAGTAGFFFLCVIASLNSLRRAGEICKLEIAIITASSSCLSMRFRQEHWKVLPLNSSSVALLETKCRNQLSQRPFSPISPGRQAGIRSFNSVTHSTAHSTHTHWACNGITLSYIWVYIYHHVPEGQGVFPAP